MIQGDPSADALGIRRPGEVSPGLLRVASVRSDDPRTAIRAGRSVRRSAEAAGPVSSSAPSGAGVFIVDLQPSAAMLSPQDVLEFWFSDDAQSKWWVKDSTFDELVRSRLGEAHRAALAGQLDEWAKTPEGALALVLLLDQVPRNIHRGSPDAFACDAKARSVTKAAIEAGHDAELADDSRRLFLYLPLEHSEVLADQERCLELTRPLTPTQWYDFAVKHHRIIARFGRFPHRNAVLGRESTAEELAFLREPGSSF